MTPLEELEKSLGLDCGHDYWSDEEVLFAAQIVARLRPTDWETLRSLWRDRPAEWQYRLASVLSHGDRNESVTIFSGMLESNDDELILTAADHWVDMNNLLPHFVSAKAQSRLQEVIRSHQSKYPGKDAFLEPIKKLLRIAET